MHGLFYGSYIVLWILLIVLTVLVLLLYRHFGMMSLGTLEGIQRDGLPLGESASELVGVTMARVNASRCLLQRIIIRTLQSLTMEPALSTDIAFG